MRVVQGNRGQTRVLNGEGACGRRERPEPRPAPAEPATSPLPGREGRPTQAAPRRAELRVWDGVSGRRRRARGRMRQDAPTPGPRSRGGRGGRGVGRGAAGQARRRQDGAGCVAKGSRAKATLLVAGGLPGAPSLRWTGAPRAAAWRLAARSRTRVARRHALGRAASVAAAREGKGADSGPAVPRQGRAGGRRWRVSQHQRRVGDRPPSWRVSAEHTNSCTNVVPET